MLSRTKLAHYRNLLHHLAERHRADLALLRGEAAHHRAGLGSQTMIPGPSIKGGEAGPAGRGKGLYTQVSDPKA